MPVDIVAVTVRHGGRVVLNDVSARFAEGSVSAVLGPSGAGKSTLLAVLAGLVQPDAGRVDLHGMAPSQVSLIAQTVPLLHHRSVLDNIAVGGLAVGARYGEARREAGALLAELSLRHLADTRVHRLSGGERGRVAILRSIVMGSAVLLADEPTASLDQGNRNSVVRVLRSAADRGAVVIVATHDSVVAESADQTIALWAPV